MIYVLMGGALLLLVVGVVAGLVHLFGRLALGPAADGHARSAALGLLMGVGVFVAGSFIPQDLGLVEMLAPGVGALVALLLIGCRPGAVHPTAGEAGLEPRRVTDLGPAWLFGIPAGTFLVMLAVLTFFATTAHADEAGLQRAVWLRAGDVTRLSGPYPGWFYCLPALILSGVLLLATAWTLHRLAGQPLRGTPEQRAQSLRWRRGAAGLTMAVSTGAFLLYTGGVTLVGGWATLGLTFDKSMSISIPVLEGLALAEILLGVALVLVGCALWLGVLVRVVRGER